MNQSSNALRVQDDLALGETQALPAAARPEDVGTGTRAAIQIWTGPAIADQIHSKMLNTAYRRWLYSKVSRLPRLRDVPTSSSFDDTILYLKVGNDHLVLAQSESYIRNMGKDLRGLLLSELKVATANSLREVFDDCLARQQPSYARFISSLSDRNAYWESLNLPLSVDGRSKPVLTLSCMAMLSEKIDVLQVFYDRSPIGIVAAVPIMDGQNKTDDARILTMNAKARQILRQDESRIELHSIGEMIRFLGKTLQWTATGTATDGQQTQIRYRDGAGEEFTMTIEMINQFVLISLAEQAKMSDQPSPMNRFARLLGLT
jgi:PAS domain-containing protein